MWVFGYGSLMWRPGFPYQVRKRALLQGYHRAFCVRTVHHRGTPERPGLVMGLKPGGHCMGVAFRVRTEQAKDVLAYLEERELRWYPVYQTAGVEVELEETGIGRDAQSRGAVPGRTVNALTYLPKHDHHDYLGNLSVTDAAEIIASAEGVSGRNIDYVRDAIANFRTLMIEEPEIEAVAAVLDAES